MNRVGASSGYFEIVRLRVHELITYPLELIGGWASFPLTMIIFYVVYGTIYQSQSTLGGLSFTSLLTYLALAQAFRKVGDSFGEGEEIQEEIKQGDLFAYLTRPISYFGVRLSKQFGEFLTKSLIAIPLIYVAGFVILGTWLPIERFILGLLLAMLGGLVIFQIYFSIGLLSFWFEEIWGFQRGVITMTWLFSGSVIPIALLPTALQTLAKIIPFQHQAAVPAQFILGQIGYTTLGESALILGGWFILMTIIQSWLWKKGLEKNDGKG